MSMRKHKGIPIIEFKCEIETCNREGYCKYHKNGILTFYTPHFVQIEIKHQVYENTCGSYEEESNE